jgi:cell division protein FtsI (penicillin-binding protein 3)
VANQVAEMMKTVVGPEGTGKRAAIPGYSVAGKTGTAHKVGAHGYEDRYRSLFIGFAPASSPRVVAAIVVDDASLGRYHGGDVAAPVFAKVVSGAMRLLNVAPDQTLPQIADGQSKAANGQPKIASGQPKPAGRGPA